MHPNPLFAFNAMPLGSKCPLAVPRASLVPCGVRIRGRHSLWFKASDGFKRMDFGVLSKGRRLRMAATHQLAGSPTSCRYAPANPASLRASHAECSEIHELIAGILERGKLLATWFQISRPTHSRRSLTGPFRVAARTHVTQEPTMIWGSVAACPTPPRERRSRGREALGSLRGV